MQKRLLALFLCLSLFLPACQKNRQAEELRVIFINVGKADAACISLGDAYYMVDVGTKESADAMFDALSAFGVEAKKGLKGVFLTHSHSDHIGGLKKLSAAYPIECVYRANFGEVNDSGLNKIEKQTDKLSLKCRVLFAGETVRLSKDVYFEVLGPVEYNAKDDNDNSLILMLHAYGKKLLLTGDMQFSEEKSLLERGVKLEADVLKVGNHGNPDATGEEFAAAVTPELAVISTDRKEDTDSANERVLALLAMAEILITEETEQGIYISIRPGGEMTWEVR